MEPFEIHIPSTHGPFEIIFSKNTWRYTIFHNRTNGEKTVYKIMPQTIQFYNKFKFYNRNY